MSLVRLLTAGKSLVGSQNPQSRYHLSRRPALPTFGGKQNPFRATTLPEAAQSATPAPTLPPAEPAHVVVPARAEGLGMPLTPAPEAAAPNVAGSAPGSEPLAPAAMPGFGRGALVRYAEKFKSWLALGRRPAGGRVAPRLVKPMVQCELSLERVRVVRNDLSDSDVEIVARSAPATEAVEKAPGGAWEKVAERLFGAGQV